MSTVICLISEVRKGQHGVTYLCDNCGCKSYERKSHFDKKKRHFCCQACYSEFRATKLPKEEQHAYGAGHSQKERERRMKCRGATNKAIIAGVLKRGPCEKCGSKLTEAHHDDYDKPLDVRWMCFTHHRQWHKENPELLEK